MPKLVIVESPAKAKTISRFLGKDYVVEASFGHVRDLPERADEIPADKKELKWAKLGVNVDGDFEPLYVVPADKKRHVDTLKRSSKEATELLLATDEDREGESISWHILQLLKPGKKPVRRIVFHEITPEAIDEALKNPRDLDENLVRAQETRRILDRLYGYSLSPLLWKKVAPKLSAGRVQSVAVRLIVERERERMRFKSSEYWDLEAKLSAKEAAFNTTLVRIGEQTVASGKDFNSLTGELASKARHLRQPDAEALRDVARESRPWRVTDVEEKDGSENPPAPFMTSTLQQEANRKLRFASKRTMQIAQKLYEGIDLDGERVGLITYMRTDSLNLAERALEQAREVIRSSYGPEFLPSQPKRYKTKAKGAQEAHEAIRPTDLQRRPQDVKRYLSDEEFKLYELIWKRTIASQMLPAKTKLTRLFVGVQAGQDHLTFATSGKQIVFPGFLQAYTEGSDDPEADLAEKETILPVVKKGDELGLVAVEAKGHTTKPPARYTEASLVKKLEEEGIGRPSTYSSIITTVQDRGYVNKRANELVPTFTAFAVTELLEDHFAELVDIRFTANMETELDEIAEGERDWVKHLREFYHGDQGHPGLEPQINNKQKDIPFPAIELGETPDGQKVVVRVGRFGTFVQRGEGGPGHRANVPDDLAPAELTLEAALELIERSTLGPESIGVDRQSGRCVLLRKGRFGDYLEVAQTEGEQASGEKPRRVTLPPGVSASELTEADLQLLLTFPRILGHTDGGDPITVAIGQYGPYLKAGNDTRNVSDWRTAATMTLAEAHALLAAPKVGRNGRPIGAPRAASAPIQEFGELEGAAGPVRVLSGRFGPYVTDGSVNATLPRSMDPATISADEAMELIRAKAAAGPVKRKGRFTRKTTKTGKSAAKSKR